MAVYLRYGQHWLDVPDRGIPARIETLTGRCHLLRHGFLSIVALEKINSNGMPGEPKRSGTHSPGSSRTQKASDAQTGRPPKMHLNELPSGYQIFSVKLPPIGSYWFAYGSHIEGGSVLSNGRLRIVVLCCTALAALVLPSTQCHAHAVLLLEEPYGFFGTIIPTGHNAIYFEQICAETPLKLRHCKAGELGAVVTRDPDVGGYDWVAIPLLPYLYSVENPAEVPAVADRKSVWRMRHRYHETHLRTLGEKVAPGNLFKGGWALLVGMAYERRIYAFSFETTAEQDDALIARMNASKNRTHFDFLYNNCSDFARLVLNMYFPRTFHREIFSDAGITTPKAIAHQLVKYARKHPELELSVFEIPQVPGYRRQSRANKSVTESLATTGYVVPIALASPYVAGGLFVDYLVRGKHHVIPRNPKRLSPDSLTAMTIPASSAPALVGIGTQAPAWASVSAEIKETASNNSGATEASLSRE